MLMKRLLLMTMVLIGGGLAANAYNYPYLTLKTADGAMKSVPVTSLVLTFADGQLVATTTDGAETFVLNDLNSMHFSQTDETAEKSVVDAISGMEVMPADGITVYTLSGTLVGRYDTMAQAKTALRAGVYLFKMEGKTMKISVKK